MHHVPGHHAMCQVIVPCASSSGHHASRACVIMRHVPAQSCAMCLHHHSRISSQDTNILSIITSLIWPSSLGVTTTISYYLRTDFALSITTLLILFTSPEVGSKVTSSTLSYGPRTNTEVIALRRLTVSVPQAPLNNIQKRNNTWWARLLI
jgi:hypothetical protein